VQSLRQLEEEAEAKLLAEKQVREQMSRIQALTSEREAAARLASSPAHLGFRV
jgi:hypothetical protein